MKNFDFELEFIVTEFTVSAQVSGGYSKSATSKNANFSKDQIELMSGLGNGQRVIFENIKAVGPSGDIRKLNDIVLKIN